MKTYERLDGVLVGVAAHPVLVLLAEEMTARGLRIAVVDGRAESDTEIVPGVPLLSCDGRVSKSVQNRCNLLESTIRVLEERVVNPRSRESLTVFEAEFGNVNAASVVAPIVMGEKIGAVVTGLAPQFVFINHLFHFGWAGVRSGDTTRVVMPWGDDIFDYASATPLAKQLVKRSLNSADLIVPSAASSRDVLESLGAPSNRVHPISWGVDLSKLPVLEKVDKRVLRRRLNLDIDATVVFNSRRLKTAWGSDQTISAMMEIAERYPSSHHVTIAGVGNWDDALRARDTIAKSGLSSQFTILTGEVSMATYLDYCQASDIALSLKLTRDMRSLSILQCAAAGLKLICSDQPEYRVMEQEGFVAQFVDPLDRGSLVAAIDMAIVNSPTLGHFAARNRAFIEAREDRSKQFELLLSVIEQACSRRADR